MKSFKLLLLLGLLTVTGCEKEEVKDNTSNQETPASDVTRDEPKENNNSTDTPSNNAEDNNNTTENNDNGEDNTNTENGEENHSSTEEQGTTYTVNFYNSSCPTLSTENINTGLKDYINTTMGNSFVNEIKNTSCQMSNDIPRKGEHVLIIGASSTTGSLEIFFSTPIKKFTITAQTYHKPYVETWNGNREIVNVDSNSMLSVTGDATIPLSVIDLTSEDEEPLEKTLEFKDFNCNKLHLTSTNAEKGRVFVKEIKFVL